MNYKQHRLLLQQEGGIVKSTCKILSNPPAHLNSFGACVQSFEAAHGNEDTFREMLRIKRSVAASFSQTHYNSALSEAALAAAAGSHLQLLHVYSSNVWGLHQHLGHLLLSRLLDACQ